MHLQDPATKALWCLSGHRRFGGSTDVKENCNLDGAPQGWQPQGLARVPRSPTGAAGAPAGTEPWIERKWPCKFRLKKSGGGRRERTAQNALMQLNEIKPGLQYTLLWHAGRASTRAPLPHVRRGPADRCFEGSEPHEEEGQAQRGREKALRSFVQFPRLQAHLAGHSLSHQCRLVLTRPLPGRSSSGPETPDRSEVPFYLGSNGDDSFSSVGTSACFASPVPAGLAFRPAWAPRLSHRPAGEPVMILSSTPGTQVRLPLSGGRQNPVISLIVGSVIL